MYTYQWVMLFFFLEQLDIQSSRFKSFISDKFIPYGTFIWSFFDVPCSFLKRKGKLPTITKNIVINRKITTQIDMTHYFINRVSLRIVFIKINYLSIIISILFLSNSIFSIKCILLDEQNVSTSYSDRFFISEMDNSNQYIILACGLWYIDRHNVK